MQERETQATELATADRDGVILWLRDSTATPETRRGVAARILTSSVYQQAGILGLVGCVGCGDQGCDWCRTHLGDW